MTNELIMVAQTDGGGSEMMAAIIGGVVGSLIGGGLASLVAWQSHKHNVSLERKQTEETIDGILQAIRIEWQVMLKEYEWFGERLKEVQQGQAFTYFFKITRDYFIVYPNNTSIVGQINDAELCRLIVTAYTKASTFIDAIEVNNENERRLREYETLHLKNTEFQDSKGLEKHKIRMVEFVPLLGQSYQELKKDAGKLTKAIDDYRQLHPVKTD